jgi:hypothetical protein
MITLICSLPILIVPIRQILVNDLLHTLNSNTMLSKLPHTWSLEHVDVNPSGYTHLVNEETKHHELSPTNRLGISIVTTDSPPSSNAGNAMILGRLDI